jgi:iron complex outermembrane receptor protein
LPSPFDGFGFTANYTYVKSQQTVDTVNGPISTSLPGTAKNNVNATFYYEKYGFSARAAYNYRGNSVYVTGGNSYDGQLIDQQYIKAYSTLDASISQTLLNDHLQIIVSGTNLTNANQIVYWGPAQMLQQFNPLPRVFTVALRGRF